MLDPVLENDQIDEVEDILTKEILVSLVYLERRDQSKSDLNRILKFISKRYKYKSGEDRPYAKDVLPDIIDRYENLPWFKFQSKKSWGTIKRSNYKIERTDLPALLEHHFQFKLSINQNKNEDLELFKKALLKKLEYKL